MKGQKALKVHTDLQRVFVPRKQQRQQGILACYAEHEEGTRSCPAAQRIQCEWQYDHQDCLLVHMIPRHKAAHDHIDTASGLRVDIPGSAQQDCLLCRAQREAPHGQLERERTIWDSKYQGQVRAT